MSSIGGRWGRFDGVPFLNVVERIFTQSPKIGPDPFY